MLRFEMMAAEVGAILAGVVSIIVGATSPEHNFLYFLVGALLVVAPIATVRPGDLRVDNGDAED